MLARNNILLLQFNCFTFLALFELFTVLHLIQCNFRALYPIQLHTYAFDLVTTARIPGLGVVILVVARIVRLS